ncbi:MAG: hypothetical protein QOE70_1141 [Chthoniobacter sp.]|nr:hypothetical protein [Chthoniobacter sp.]
MPGIDSPGARGIQQRMTRVLTIRIPPDLLSRAEAKAARLGLDRAKYVRGLIEEDLAEKGRKPKHKFASEDLIGSVPIGKGPYTNQRVREMMRAKLLAKREKNR